MTYQIISDSTCDLSPEQVKKYNIHLMPLYVQLGDKTFRDGVDIHPDDIYAHVAAGGDLAATAAVNLADYVQVFSEYSRKADFVIHVTISSDFSCCYQNACLAAADYENVYVVDSLSAAIGTGILAEYAIGCAEAGMDAVSLAAHLEQKRADICVIGLLDTLEYLKRGGRISKTVAFAGGLLSIKPVVTIQDGEIALIGKARGSRQGNNLLVEKIHACGGIDFQLPILLGYTGLSDAFLRKYVDDSRALWEHGTDSLDEALISGVIGTHTGPGAVAVAFFRKL